LVSVIIPAYNQGNYIGDAIESVLKQDYPADQIEIIVVDDGSTDTTNKVIQRFGERIKYCRQEHSGQALAVKAGIDIVKGDAIFILNSDDIFKPNKISAIMHIFNSDDQVNCVSHPAIYRFMDSGREREELFPRFIRDKKVYGEKALSFFYKKNKLFGGGSSVAFRTHILKKLDIKREINMSIDEYLVIFSLKKGFSFFLNKHLSFYRIHTQNYSVSRNQERLRNDLLVNEIVLREIMKDNFNEEFKFLFTLKTKISSIRLKEFLREERVQDILCLWRFILLNRRIIKRNILMVILRYRVIQRSLALLF
jgi:glycosyltransferase involved in cell wall biosynthesis